LWRGLIALCRYGVQVVESRRIRGNEEQKNTVISLPSPIRISPSPTRPALLDWTFAGWRKCRCPPRTHSTDPACNATHHMAWYWWRSSRLLIASDAIFRTPFGSASITSRRFDLSRWAVTQPPANVPGCRLMSRTAVLRCRSTQPVPKQNCAA